ncbi:MAG TPA: hypothetical protein VJ765_07170 [Chitinophagaceae bacterium]|nr:hypothetical protein [Chitinophagaceae bacterium]
MKKISFRSGHRFLLVSLFSFWQVVLLAQDSASKVTTTTTTSTRTEWYTSPWVWVIGGAVFILILIALLRGNSSTDREVTRTTVIKDDRG